MGKYIAAQQTIGRDICAIIKPFEENRPEFEVILEEYCAGLSHSMDFDDVDKFIVEFKKIIDAMDQIDEIIKNLMFCQVCKMYYENLKEELKANFGNHYYESNVCGNNLICLAMSERADCDITAEILHFENDADTFSVKFTVSETNREFTKEYSFINDFIIDFKDILNLMNKTERIYNNIFCK